MRTTLQADDLYLYNISLNLFKDIPNLCGHNPTQAIFFRVQDAGSTQNQWDLAGFDPITVILNGTSGLSLPHGIGYDILGLILLSIGSVWSYCVVHGSAWANSVLY